MTLKNEKIMIYEQKRNLRQIRWLIFWVLLSLTVISTITATVFSFIEQTALLQYSIMAITHILAVLLPLIIFFKITKETNTPESLGKIRLRLNSFSLSQALVIIILAAAGQLIIAISDIPIQMLLGISTSLAPRNGIELFIGIIAIAIIPSILEEFLFRGVLFGGMEQQSTIFAAIFSTFIFALLHSNVLGFFGYMFLGIMTVMIMLRTNSLYAAILYHFIYNLSAFMLSYFVSQNMSISFIVWLFLSAVVVFIVSMFIFRLVTPNAPRYKAKNTTSLLLENIFSIPIILCMVITIIVQYFRFFA